jgi:hypothetical protein
MSDTQFTTSRVPCFECGNPPEYDHHVVPNSRGGTKTVPLCGECHGKAHHRDKAMSSGRLTAEALAAKRARGEKVGGPPPFGFQVADDGKTLVPHDEQQEVLALIKTLRESGTKVAAISDHLNDRGIPRGVKGRWDYQYVSTLCNRHGVKPDPLKLEAQRLASREAKRLAKNEAGRLARLEKIEAKRQSKHDGRVTIANALHPRKIPIILRFMTDKRDLRLETVDKRAKALNLQLTRSTPDV